MVAVGADWGELAPSEQPIKSRPETITVTKNLMRASLKRLQLCVSGLTRTGQIRVRTPATAKFCWQGNRGCGPGRRPVARPRRPVGPPPDAAGHDHLAHIAAIQPDRLGQQVGDQPSARDGEPPRFPAPKVTGTSQRPGTPAGRAGQGYCSNLGGLHPRRGRSTSPNSARIPLPVGLGTPTTPWRAVRVPKPGCGTPGEPGVHSCGLVPLPAGLGSTPAGLGPTRFGVAFRAGPPPTHT